MHGSGSRASRRAPFRADCDHRQSAELRPHPLRRSAAHPAAHDLHHAVERRPAHFRIRWPVSIPACTDRCRTTCRTRSSTCWRGAASAILVNEFREADARACRRSRCPTDPSLLEDHEVPFTYLWPASLVPKPRDWGPHIDLANFIFYDQRAHLSAAARLHDVPRRRRSRRSTSASARRSSKTRKRSAARSSRRSKRPARAASCPKGGRISVAQPPPPNVHLIGDASARLAVPALPRRVPSRWRRVRPLPACAPGCRPSWCRSSAISSSGER